MSRIERLTLTVAFPQEHGQMLHIEQLLTMQSMVDDSQLYDSH